MGYFCNLPEDCVSRILSLTSPQDVCTMLVVSKDFRSPAESDIVWHQFLPTDCSHIVSSTSFNFSTKKQLFFSLSDQYNLIDAGYKAFKLEKSTGRKSYILSARDLSILHSNDEANWTWKSIQQSRFDEVAELKRVERLYIQGKIRAHRLSPNTNYGAYLIFKISGHAYGLDSIPCEVSIVSNDTVSTTNAFYLHDPDDDKKRHLQSVFYGNRMQRMKDWVMTSEEKMAAKREDGWLEIEVGEFFVGVGGGESDEEIEMNVMEVKGYQLKGGLIVEGIEVRPIYI